MTSSDRPNGPVAVSAILRHWRDAVPNDRMAHLVKDVWRGLTRAFGTRLGEQSVLFGHWVFLRILWERDGITQTELSEEAGLMLPTTHAAVSAMERLGYVRRGSRPGEGRRVFIHLTAQGHAMRKPLLALAEEVNGIALRDISEGDIATTRRTLLAMVENLAQDELDLIKAERHHPSTRELVGRGPADRPGPTRRRAGGV